MWGSERSKAEMARQARCHVCGVRAVDVAREHDPDMTLTAAGWLCVCCHEPNRVAPVAVLGARARRHVEEALILGELDARERARWERARAAVIGGYWTDDLGEVTP